MRHQCNWNIPGKGRFAVDLEITDGLLLMALVKKANRRIKPTTTKVTVTAFDRAITLKMVKV